ncbi:shikimate kinase [Limibaculum sp. M0105]|uniref:Shikimate kinase n=1 Tax=Thermohalobaculum xanthum TaxID=2753746 RepID=A0A8J7M4Z9_9RHOB|nr:shikimate kinase [Thermohalobaculum xanthum]
MQGARPGVAKQARTASVEGPTLRRPIVLIGLMGAGKSSVGQRLAERLGVPFADSDAEIERAAAMSIAEIFERYGEPHFRDGERRVIARLLQEPPMVLATGGGAFMNPETRALIAQGATSVWLKAGLDLLVSRTAGRTHRPLLNRGNPRETLARLIRDRYPVYAEAAVTVESEAGFTHDEMASRIIAALEAHGAFLPAPRDE